MTRNYPKRNISVYLIHITKQRPYLPRSLDIRLAGAVKMSGVRMNELRSEAGKIS